MSVNAMNLLKAFNGKPLKAFSAALEGSADPDTALAVAQDARCGLNIRMKTGRKGFMRRHTKGKTRIVCPLTIAILKGRLDVAEGLIRLGAHVNVKDDSNDVLHPLAAALRARDEFTRSTMVKYLMDNGADPHLSVFDHFDSIIRVAELVNVLHLTSDPSRFDIATVDCLITNGADVNWPNLVGETPLHYAAIHGNMLMIDLLVAHGAHLEAKNRDGRTPLLTAAIEGKSIESLVKAGADVHANIRGMNVLHCAVSQYNHSGLPDVIRLGADINGVDSCDWTPLHYASWVGCPFEFAQSVDLLLPEGADVNAEDNKGRTPLFYAGRAPEVAALLDAGADMLRLVDGGCDEAARKILLAEGAIFEEVN